MVLRFILAVLVVVCTLAIVPDPVSAQNGLQLNIYNNTALTGVPSKSTTIPTLEFTLPAVVSSAEVLGTVKLVSGETYAYYCTFDGVTFGFLWVDDHLVCQIGAYMNPNLTLAPATPTVEWGQDNPLPVLSKTELPIRLQVFQTTGGGTNQMSIRILVQNSTSSSPPSLIPTSFLSPALNANEIKRRELQSSLVRGWGQWVLPNILDHVQLPSAVRFRTEVCHLPTSVCLNQTVISGTSQSGVVPPVPRVGTFAVDKSYVQFYLSWMDVNISLSYSASGPDNGDYFILIEPVACPNTVCDDYVVRVVGNYAWGRAGSVVSPSNSQLHYAPWGLPEVDLYLLSSNANPSKALPTPDGPYVLVSLNKGPAALSTKPSLSVPDVEKLIQNARATEMARYQKYGDLSQEKEAMQSSLMWNYIYNPAELGPILPVSRGWSFAQNPISYDWSYVLFDWDNYFASYMAALDPLMKDICYSNIIQITKAKTGNGFVPNWSSGGAKTVDRSEPAVGAKILLEIFQKYKDLWLVELLLDDLVDWNNFLWNNRRLNNGMTWGSLLCSNFSCLGYVQDESGMDNSPMWDCPGSDPHDNGGNCSLIFDTQTRTMLINDVGATSLYLQDTTALTRLAAYAGRKELAAELLLRGLAMDFLVQGLWDDEIGAYSNMLEPSGQRYRRISPTSFYPLMTSAGREGPAQRLVTEWLTSSSRFCIDTSGNWPNDNSTNHELCWWGLPSISFDDPSFWQPTWSNYWRGFVWAPTAQLTYWGLTHSQSPIVQKGRQQFVYQMRSMFMTQWHLNHHCCENFSPFKNATECTGDRFYSWGALALMISFLEQGYF